MLVATTALSGLTDGFFASDVAFHRALVDAACNPVLSWRLAGIETDDSTMAEEAVGRLSEHTQSLAHEAMEQVRDC